MTGKIDIKKFSVELRGCVKKSKIRPEDVKNIWHMDSKSVKKRKRKIVDPLEKDWNNKFDEHWNKY